MIKPTKKQKLVLDFIAAFIKEHGYAPSYREIKAEVSLSSVSTVAHHVNELIQRGYLRKRDKSARSLEVVGIDERQGYDEKDPAGHKWLIDTIDSHFTFVENNPNREQKHIDTLYVLVGTLKILGLEGAFSAFQSRLGAISNTQTK